MVLNLGADLQEFIDNHVKSFVHWDLLVMLTRQPGLAEGAERIAMRMGRAPEEVARALDELSREGVLRRADRSTGAAIYTLADSHAAQARQFVEALDRREQRLIILTQVLRRGGSGH